MKKIIFIFIGLILLTIPAVAQDKSILIEGYDRLRYSVEEIRVSPGITLEITLKTISSMPKSQMAHNWVLLKQDVDADEFVENSEEHKENKYIDPKFSDQMVITTDMLGGGEKDVVTFKVPEKKGTYMYVCTFPNHYAAGMKGKLIVE